ncbi:trimeric intracellular cation channel family protein [Chitinophaga nivalis]|uniref:Trimeric intracellular cation channel family protein n=1 Tax=Chitinophaga nivalis TaxID=2991709 RepID=A0ABT3ILG7_9BACT|nr:trimeric intracellular cation channel family protein [Chitinophaga nivalis]MCW3465493.1 trimeric intracellular cation channel family protein [Chitinophaga nivalis]MCW3484816.1 trimeric intracellular cation channel family protein [Chitinophaga nivalis]
MQLTFIQVLELLGIFAFAISGATAAINKSYDVIGLLALAFITSVGGGTIRDLLTGATPVAWITDERSNIAIIIAAIITALFFSYVKKLNRWLNTFDAIGLGLFTITGINKGVAGGFPMPVCLLLGVITGTFGGLLRDVITGEHPILFTREIYAVASIAGGVLYLIGIHTNIPRDIILSVTVAVIVTIRLLSLRYNWQFPRLKA